MMAARSPAIRLGCVIAILLLGCDTGLKRSGLKRSGLDAGRETTDSAASDSGEQYPCGSKQVFDDTCGATPHVQGDRCQMDGLACMASSTYVGPCPYQGTYAVTKCCNGRWVTRSFGNQSGADFLCDEAPSDAGTENDAGTSGDSG